MKKLPLTQSCFLLVVFACSCATVNAVTLPFSDSFESGDFRRWDGGRIHDFSVSPASAHSGIHAACGTSSSGKKTDYYQDANFGDHPRADGKAVKAGLYVKFAHKFDAGFDPGTTANHHKVLLINFEDGNDLRREQIILNVFGNIANRANRGQYVVENIHWNADRSFNSSRFILQNRGVPVSYRPSQWDIIKIYIQPNTSGRTDGAVRVWVNGEIKIEHTGISIRKTTYNPNLVIIGYYAPYTDIRGTRCWDDIMISESDPDEGEHGSLNPPAQTR